MCSARCGGFDVVHVTDPAVALRRIADEPWDLALADLDLPYTTGLDLLAAVRRIAPSLPVVITTARAVEPAPAHVRYSLADAFLQKPVGPQRLTMVAALIGQRRGG